jgi:hypothetical protein
VALVRTQDSSNPALLDNLVLWLNVTDYKNIQVSRAYGIVAYSRSSNRISDYPVKAELRYKIYDGVRHKAYFVSAERHPVFEVKSIDFSAPPDHVYLRAEMQAASTGTTGITNVFGATSVLLVENDVYVGGNAGYDGTGFSNHFYPLLARFNQRSYTQLDLSAVFMVKSGP